MKSNPQMLGCLPVCGHQLGKFWASARGILRHTGVCTHATTHEFLAVESIRPITVLSPMEATNQHSCAAALLEAVAGVAFRGGVRSSWVHRSYFQGLRFFSCQVCRGSVSLGSIFAVAGKSGQGPAYAHVSFGVGVCASWSGHCGVHHPWDACRGDLRLGYALPPMAMGRLWSIWAAIRRVHGVMYVANNLTWDRLEGALCVIGCRLLTVIFKFKAWSEVRVHGHLLFWCHV